jgi:hypothetical protein
MNFMTKPTLHRIFSVYSTELQTWGVLKDTSTCFRTIENSLIVLILQLIACTRFVFVYCTNPSEVALGSVVSCCTMLQAGSLKVQDPMRWMHFFSIFLIPPTALRPGVYSASDRNEYQKQKHNVSWEQRAAVAEGCQLTTICERLSSNVGSLTSHKPYRPSRPVTGIALLYGDGVCSCEVRTGL